MVARVDQLVGREAELGAISAFLANRDALPAGLRIEGAAGIGKTTVWRAGTDEALARGYRVLSCRAVGTEIHLLFSGLSDLLVDHVADALPTLPAPQRRAMETVLLLGDESGVTADERAVAAGVLGLLRGLAREGPLLVAIDDAQWLDPASVVVLEYAIRRLRESPVGVLGAWRFDPLAPSSEADGRRGLNLDRAFDRPPERLSIGPLSMGAIHHILRLRTSQSLPRPLLRRIHEASGGNPLYALELARATGERQGTWDRAEPLALGATVTELLTGRFAALNDQTRAALFVAAAASQPTAASIAAVLDDPGAASLRPAEEAGIVRLSGPRVEFTHPLLAAAAASLPSDEARRHWHERLAAVATDPEARARHLAVARPGRGVEVAELLHDAAQHAAARGAPATAGELFTEAIGRLPDGTDARRAAWAVEAAPVLRRAGDARQARAVLEEVVGWLPPGPLRADALLALAGLVADDAGGSALELDLIERSLADAGDDPARRAAGLLMREMWERHQDRFAAALPLAREALMLAERTGDPVLLAGTLTRTADLEFLVGLAPDPVARFERAMAAGAGLHLDASADSAPSMLAACLIRAGRVAEARTLLHGERERVIAQGDEASLAMLCVLLTELEWLAGAWDTARAHVTEGMLVADQADARLMQGALSAMLALVEASQGEIARARERAQEAVRICEQVGDRSYASYAHHVLGFIELSAGEYSAAADHLGSYSVELGIEGTKRLAFVGDGIEALILSGRRDEAAALTDELERRGEQLHRPTLLIGAARCRGLALGTDGEMDAAEMSARQAVDLATGLGLPFERARALLVLGDIQRRAKRRGAARETLTSAMAAFDAVGAAPWSARAADALARVGGRVRQAGLTPTEFQVASLVARGMTNKEVAAELFVTVRAVEANLSRIYAKLEVRSRTELAKRL